MDPITAVYTIAVLQLISATASQFLPPLPFPFPPGALPGIPQVGPPNGLPPPNAIQMPGSVPMPMSMPFAVQQPRVPLVVMPYHSKKRNQAKRIRKKRKRPSKKYIYDDSSSESDSDSSSGDFDFRAKSKRGKKRQVLTPVVSYVTKDGYVVYQKKIKREKARDWLEMGRTRQSNLWESGEKDNTSENTSKARELSTFTSWTSRRPFLSVYITFLV
ncbi:hypothetical protein K1T71_006416 [Dendrolimus kikuchii]|uniref:Uncharacterized protein n=1 Tax=Dendrolimus kikuchii TaxID=765133 RepID=A0ACC1D0Y0_9NEOP|nr:hypothetical protein K1T71_006416 [Dendrolimus kikuchii]